eukprot:324342-Hanusia_phi.AAC.1
MQERAREWMAKQSTSASLLSVGSASSSDSGSQSSSNRGKALKYVSQVNEELGQRDRRISFLTSRL